MDKKQEYIKELISIIQTKKLSKNEISKLKINLCSKYKLKEMPSDIEIMLSVSLEDLKKIKKYLVTKPSRTLSGVAVVAVMTKPFKCPHGKCIYCPGGVNSAFGDVPQSYTGKEPATRRAIRNNYDAYLQVFNRLEQYVVLGHIAEKIELIIMGGTFPSFPKNYQKEFIKYCFKAMNDFSDLFYKDGKIDIIRFKDFFELPGNVDDKKRGEDIHKKLLRIKHLKKTTLEKEQEKNEISNIRCVGLTIETRPDYATLDDANFMLNLGCTRVELGAQTVYDDILKKIERGHSIKDTINATKTLKDLGFKINYHLMPGLPGVSFKKDLEALKEIFSNEDFRPDMLKIYPCMVLKGTKLYKLWKEKKFAPLTTEKAAKLISEFKKYVPEYCRIMRVQRDIPTFVTEAGVDRTNLRQYIEKLMNKKGIKCRCIRCREIGRANKKIGRIYFKITEYVASEGKEFFISAESKDKIIGFCRLRFPSEVLRKEITKNSSLVRELHVYGESIEIGKKGSIQHRGIGKRLLAIAEDISKTYYKNKVVVISAVGTREYYKKLGYRREGVYMAKKI